MKKRKTANAIMVAVIAVIVIGGVLVAGHIRGWFDKTPDAAVLTGLRGIVTMEREGIAYNVQEDTALRKGDKISCAAAASVKIDAGESSLVLGENAQIVVEDPSRKSFSFSILQGEVFADAGESGMSVSTVGGKTVSLRKTAASFSIRAGAESMSVFSGEADGVKAGNVKEWVGTQEYVHELDINSLNDFNIAQIRAAGDYSGYIIAKADVDALEEKRQAEKEEAIRQAEAEEAARKAAEEAAKKAEEEKKAAEEAAAKEAKEKAEKEAAEKARAEAQKKAAEEAAAKAEAEKKAAEEAAKAEAEKKAAEEAAAKAEAEKKAAEEAAAKAQTEADKKAAEEAAAKAEAERKAAEEAAAKAEAEKKAAEEAAAKAEAEKKAAEKAAAKAEAERKAAEEEAARKAAEEEAARKAAEEEAAKKAAEEEAKKTYCYITIRCDTILNNMDDLDPAKAPYVPSSGVILGKKKVEFADGETVCDVLKRVCKNYGIQLEYSYTPMYESYYIEGINHIYEFDCGPESGWIYKVNGWAPNYGCSSYYLKNDDNIVWCYTCKGLGADV